MEPNGPFHFSLDQLASETLALTESMTSLFKREMEGLQFSSFEERAEIEEGHSREPTYPEAPGVVYRLEIGVSTFAIRALATHDIDETFIYLRSGEPALLQTLKLEPTHGDFQELGGVGYFETASLELAQMITSNLSNRRFPRSEDQLCNLSDPGFSWWLESEKNRFTIYYKSHGLGREERFLKLGPIGDRMIHAKRMQALRPLIQGLFPIKEWVSTDKVFSVESVGDHPGLQVLKEIFTHGRWPAGHPAFTASKLGLTMFLHLQEITTMRAFWRQLDSEVKS